MQIFQSTSNPNTFKYNGLTYPKNFMCIKQADTSIAIHNAYDTSYQLLGSTHYSQFQIDGVTPSNQAELMTGLSTLLFAKQFNYISQANGNNQIQSIGNISLTDNILSIEPTQWVINGLNYQTTANTNIDIPFAATGKNRIDLIIANEYNQIIRYAGVEYDEIGIAPILPLNTLYITQLSITDSNIGEPTPINVGTEFVKKSYAGSYIEPISGSNVSLTLNENGKSTIVLTSSGLTSVSGFINEDVYFLDQLPYYGKEYLIYNYTGHNVIFKQNDVSSDLPLFLTDQVDTTLKNNERIKFQFNGTGFNEIFRSGGYTTLLEYVDEQDTAVLNAANDYSNNLVVGLWDDRGSHNASGNTFPSSGGSGVSGTIKKGDIWTISVAGTLGSQNVEAGDTVRALVDSPSSTPSNWSILQNNIGYVPENTVNKATTMSGNSTSNIVFLTAKAIYDWGVGKFQDILVSGTNIKTVNGSSLLGSGNLTVGGKSIRTFYASWNLSNLNQWRLWSRSTSNMINSDANLAGGTGATPADTFGGNGFSGCNVFMITDCVALTKLSLSIRHVTSTADLEIFIKSFDFGATPGSEPNGQVLIHQTVTLTNLVPFFKDNFTIASHTLNSNSILVVSYRTTTSGAGNFNGVQLKYDFD